MSIYEKIFYKKKYISDIKLKDLILQVNKNELFNYIKQCTLDNKLSLDNDFEIFNKKLIQQNDYLEEKFNYFYTLSKENYSNEHSDYLLIEYGFGCPIWGVDKFLSLSSRKENIDYNYYLIENNWSTDIYLDCNICTRTLNINKPNEIIALFILQDLYINIIKKELYKK